MGVEFGDDAWERRNLLSIASYSRTDQSETMLASPEQRGGRATSCLSSGSCCRILPDPNGCISTLCGDCLRWDGGAFFPVWQLPERYSSKTCASLRFPTRPLIKSGGDRVGFDACKPGRGLGMAAAMAFSIWSANSDETSARSHGDRPTGSRVGHGWLHFRGTDFGWP